MNEYDIWVEGFQATGQSGSAERLASRVRGDSFRQAVVAWVATPAGDPWRGTFNAERLTFWGCRAFDNEAAARRSFG